MTRRLLFLPIAFALLLFLTASALAADKGSTGRPDPGSTGDYPRGIRGVYGESIISRVRSNWSLPKQAKNYTVVVEIKINRDGSVQKATLVRGSGNSTIDSSVLQAVTASQLEPPPAGMPEIDIIFKTDDLAK